MKNAEGIGSRMKFLVPRSEKVRACIKTALYAWLVEEFATEDLVTAAAVTGEHTILKICLYGR